MTERIRSDRVETVHATVERNGGTALGGAYADSERAREPNGTDRLAAWIDDRGIDVGRSVLLDIVVPAERCGLRAPGEDVAYTIRHGPSSDLREIARESQRGTITGTFGHG